MYLPTAKEILDHLEVSDHGLTKDGILIEYTYKGIDYKLIAGPEQSAQMLKKAGLIEKYEAFSDECIVVWFEVGSHDSNGDPISILLSDNFSKLWHTHSLNEDDALIMAAQHEVQKSLDTWASEMRSIPSLIKKAV